MGSSALAQKNITDSATHISFTQNGLNTSAAELFYKTRYNQSDSGLVITEPYRSVCKGTFYRNYYIPNSGISAALGSNTNSLEVHQPFLVLHGNITYNFNYRSYIDTPFAESDMMQHSVQTRLNINLKDKYPFTVYLTSRLSNSPYFSNATDLSVQFRQADMLDDIKKKMRANVDSLLNNKFLQLTPAQIYQHQKDGVLKSPGDFAVGGIKKAGEKYTQDKINEQQKKFKKLYETYKGKMDRLSSLQNWVKNSSRSQDLVEEKEKRLRRTADRQKDSLQNMAKASGVGFANNYFQKGDSIVKGAEQTLKEKKQQIDSLKKEVALAEKQLKLFQKNIVDSLQQLKKQISSIKDKDGLYDYLQKKGEPSGSLTGLQKTLLSVKQVGIGRSWLDYSELTVKNISLTGFNIETNPGKIYIAAAAGKVNYRFRDYMVKGNYTGTGQSVALLRAGFGKKDGNNVILTYYSGRKALLNQTGRADSAAVQRISGFSVETKAALDANNYIVGEYARSVSPNITGKILDFKSHTNEAWSIKLFSNYGNTKFTSYYRKTGEEFQSFTLFPTNNKQDAWMVKATQDIWKKRIIAEAAVRKNDFNSPAALPDYSNKNIFKSFQLTERIPKYPFVSIGYYPSSQLTLSNNNVLYENRYNTLNAIISHSYFLGKVNMNSNATYTKFYNNGIDTGFIYFNASTFTLNHTVNLKSFVLEGTATITDQSLLHQIAFEQGVKYTLRDKIAISGSAKWSRINHAQTLWGGSAGLVFWLKHIGILQMHYDKIYLPGYNRNLLPVDMGRLTFSRDF